MNPQSGKSLIEILVVLVVASILVSFAIAQFGSSKEFFGRQNLAREFKVNLERARFDSIKRRAEGGLNNLSRVTIESATSFSITTDLNQNGVLEDRESRQINFSNQSGVRFVGLTSYPVTISFDRHGHISALNGETPAQPVTPVFTICGRDCSLETADATNSNIISISPSGTVAMLAGGDTQPTFENPDVSDVDANTGVNPWVSTGNTVYPEIDPGPFPIPSPSTSPTTEPTEENPGPSTTPTPRHCNSGEKPGTANCQCMLPMTVKGKICKL